jgi:hypothetical protein
MLSTALIQEIDRLLQGGKLSRRKIAAKLGVSRATVSAIADGRRALCGKHARNESARPLTPTAPPIRCRRCGHRVYPPCLICEARKHNANGNRKMNEPTSHAG